MSTQQKNGDSRTILWALGMVLFAAVYRVVSARYLTGLPNFSPTMAMAFCCGLALPGVWAVAGPLGLIFVSDLILNQQLGQPLFGPGMFAAYACYLLAVGFGWLLRGRGLLPVFGATVFNSLFFYAVTNSLSWFKNPAYVQTWEGWVQAVTVGLPGFPPSLLFLRNSLISDLAFTFVFLVLFNLARQRQFASGREREEGSY